MGHIVVIVGHDPVRGFKVKTTDENDGTVKWIPENRITWYQSIFTEEIYQAVTYNYYGRIFLDRINVIRTLQNAHLVETNEQLGTDFNQRSGILLNDFGFVLKFKKTCQCQGETCSN